MNENNLGYEDIFLVSWPQLKLEKMK